MRWRGISDYPSGSKIISVITKAFIKREAGIGGLEDHVKREARGPVIKGRAANQGK